MDKTAHTPDCAVFDEWRPRTRLQRSLRPVALSPAQVLGDYDGIETINVFNHTDAIPRRSRNHDGTWRNDNGTFLWTPMNEYEHTSGAELLKLCRYRLPVIASSNYAQRVQTNTRSLLARHTNLIPNQSFFITINLGVLFADQLDEGENYRRCAQRLFADLHSIFDDKQPDFIHVNGFIEVASHLHDSQRPNRNLFVTDHLTERLPEDQDEVYVVHAHIVCTAFDEFGAWPQDYWIKALKSLFQHRKQVDVRAIALRKLDGQNVAEQSQNCIEYQAKKYTRQNDSDALKAANYFMRCSLPNMGAFEGVILNRRPKITEPGGAFLYRRDNFLTAVLPPWFEGLDDDLKIFLSTTRMKEYRSNNDPRTARVRTRRLHRILKSRNLRVSSACTRQFKIRITPQPKRYVEPYYDLAAPMRSEFGAAKFIHLREFSITLTMMLLWIILMGNLP